MKEIKYFHPSGKPLPNGSYFQRGGFLHECHANKNAFALQFPHLEGPVGLDAQGGVIVFPDGSKLPNFPLEAPILSEQIHDYSVGHAFQGLYTDPCGYVYNQESLTVEVDAAFIRAVFELTSYYVKKYHLKHLLVKDIGKDKIYLVEGKNNSKS